MRPRINSASIPFTSPKEPRELIRCSEVPVRSASGGYRVRVGAGVRGLLPAAALEAAPSGRCALIADRTVAGIWAAEIQELLRGAGLDVVPAFFPAGEQAKTRKSWATLTDILLGARLGRDSCVVALGGGVTGDLAGFVAATFLRGVPFIQVPTTTLAMIDASVGGKTGVDHRSGKNLIGAFHPPHAVLADPDFLATLDRKVRAQGYAEALKHGIIIDAPHARWLADRAEALLEGEGEAVEEAVVRSVEIKAAVVSEDEFEGGRRRILNFGHTVAHALELDSSYTMPHGDAVAAGMVIEARIGELLGITQRGTAARVAELVRALELPVDAAVVGRGRELAAFMASDKKTLRGVVQMVRLEELGCVGSGSETTVAISDEELPLLLEESARCP